MLHPKEDGDFWKDVDLLGLPRDAISARNAGCKYFYTDDECVYGHKSPRYTSDGRCMECAILSKDMFDDQKVEYKSRSVRSNINRAVKQLKGEKRYKDTKPCKNGHWYRWVGTNNCIQCDEDAKNLYKDSRRNAYLLKNYGITSTEYDEMLSDQGEACKICKSGKEDVSRFHVDHCHKNGFVRGILCSRCNQALGLMDDAPDTLRTAAEYIEHANA